MVPPSVFIPVAEDSNLITPLGAWALMEACQTAVEWPSQLTISVNLSPVQFATPGLIETVKNALAETGIAPSRLELEITERSLLNNSEKTQETLHELRNLGVRVAMDDFGTGYSSLSYLRSFPFDRIKIDRSFVSDISKGTEHVAIVQSVVSIAKALEMRTTAEGVESAGQQEFLTALGCDELQGYLFGHPVPKEVTPDVIAEWFAKPKQAAHNIPHRRFAS
jgi:EAL domain-containing protein (putative c-di-GMP-specific phosphodiesterase class I)